MDFQTMEIKITVTKEEGSGDVRLTIRKSDGESGKTVVNGLKLPAATAKALVISELAEIFV